MLGECRAGRLFLLQRHRGVWDFLVGSTFCFFERGLRGWEFESLPLWLGMFVKDTGFAWEKGLLWVYSTVRDEVLMPPSEVEGSLTELNGI